MVAVTAYDLKMEAVIAYVFIDGSCNCVWIKGGSFNRLLYILKMLAVLAYGIKYGSCNCALVEDVSSKC